MVRCALIFQRKLISVTNIRQKIAPIVSQLIIGGMLMTLYRKKYHNIADINP